MAQQAPRKIYRRTGADYRAGSVGWGLIELAKASRDDMLRTIFGGNNTRVSLGTGTVPVQRTGLWVPTLVPTTDGTNPTDVPAEIDRRDNAQIQTGVSGVFKTNSWETFQKMKAAGMAVHHLPSDAMYRPGADNIVMPNIVGDTSSGSDSMDLGQLATDLLKQAGTAYIQRELGPEVTTVGTGNFMNRFIDDVPDLMPGIDVVSQSPGKDYEYKYSCGGWKWVKKRRRRRRPIVTNAELGQLQGLVATLSPKDRAIWLAKRA